MARNPAHGRTESGQNPDPACTGQAVDPAAESPRKDSHKSQNSSGTELERLAAILKAIPAEHRAEFLRNLADQIEGQSK